MAVDIKELIDSPTKDELYAYVNGGRNYHQWYHDTVDRAQIMSMFHKAIDVDTSDKVSLGRILPQSAAESDEDYAHRISRTPVIPFEKKFVRAKERIFQGHGVSRTFPEAQRKSFWDDKAKHFDDQGASMDKFFRNKVFHYKEVLGFAGIVVDLLTKVSRDPDGNKEYITYTDESGNPVPYAYLVRPEEIYNFEFHQGYLRFIILKQDISDEIGRRDYRYTALTPEKAYVWEQVDAEDEEDVETFIELETEHGFGRVPFIPVKGDDDIDSAYTVGRPERYSLIPMYRTALEIAYDLQEVSLLYGHPIPVMSEETVKQLIGAVDQDGNYNPETISAELGAVVQIPDGEEFPDTLFYQPDTNGLKHLKDYLYSIIESVHKFASIRDKTQIVANTSGVSKALDTVEERGVLATSSREMETLERKTLNLMSAVRSDIDFEDDQVKYQKEFDLSTASEHFSTMTEGMAQGALTYEMYKYHAIEGLRKSGAPQDQIEKVKQDLEEFGKPIKVSASDLLDMVTDMDENKEQILKGLSKEIKILENFVNKTKNEDNAGEFDEEPFEN